MATYSDIEKARILSYPIESVLKLYGKRTDHFGRMYFSPFRDEKKPSMSVNKRENLWMDFGSGEGGNVLTLVAKLEGVPVYKAWDIIAEKDSGFIKIEPEYRGSFLESMNTAESMLVIEEVSSDFPLSHINYARSRGIPPSLLRRYCSVIIYHIKESRQQHRCIGFPNSGNGWVMRNPGDSFYAKRCTSSFPTYIGPSGALVSSPASDRIEVFEGFFDFLSWLVLKDRTKPFSDICVLNSVNNLNKALPIIAAHERVSAWMDNDEAGHEALRRIAADCPSVHGHMDEFIKAGVKDVNELLCERKHTQKKDISQKEIHQSPPSFTIKK